MCVFPGHCWGRTPGRCSCHCSQALSSSAACPSGAAEMLVWRQQWAGALGRPGERGERPPARHCAAERSLGPGGSGTAGQTHPTLLKLPALPSPQMRHKSSRASCELQHHLAPPAMASCCCVPACHPGDKNQPKSLVSVLSCGSPSREAFLTSDI